MDHSELAARLRQAAMQNPPIAEDLLAAADHLTASHEAVLEEARLEIRGTLSDVADGLVMKAEAEASSSPRHVVTGAKWFHDGLAAMGWIVKRKRGVAGSEIVADEAAHVADADFGDPAPDEESLAMDEWMTRVEKRRKP